MLESLESVRPRGHDFTLHVPTRDRHWFEVDGYEPLSASIFGAACRDANVVLDIGAQMGFYSLLAWSRNPDARVIAVEASPDNAAALRRNVEINGASVIEVMNVAFYDREGSVWLEVTEAPDNCGLDSHPNSRTVDRVEVEAITGASLRVVPGQRVVIKLDIAGHELAALEGLGEVMSEAGEVYVLVKFNPKCMVATGSDPQDLIDHLRDLGFRIFALHEIDYMWFEIKVEGEDLTTLVGNGYLNLWCVPHRPATAVSVVLHSGALSGAERSHLETCEDLLARGRMVHSVVPEPDRGLADRLRSAGSTVSVVPTYAWWATPANTSPAENDWHQSLSETQVVDALRGVDPDVVMTQTIVVPQGAAAATLLDKPHVWWIREFGDLDHGLRLPAQPEEMGAIVSALSASVVCNSRSVREHFFPGRPEAAAVISPCPNASSLPPSPRMSSRFTIGVVGALSPGKGHEDAMRAVSLLSKRGIQVDLLCVGGGSAEDVERLRDLAEDLAISEFVTFTGEVTDNVDFYALMDIVAVTSRAEAYGRVPFEATHSGVPIVYAAAGGLLDYMIPNHTGLPYRPGHVEELADAINRLFESPELRRDLQTGARQTFQKIQDDPSRIDALLAVLDRAAVARVNGDPLRAVLAWSLQGVQASHARADKAVAHRRQALNKVEWATRQRDEAVSQAVSQRVESLAALERVMKERDDLRSILNTIQSGRTWRWAAKARNLKYRLERQVRRT